MRLGKTILYTAAGLVGLVVVSHLLVLGYMYAMTKGSREIRRRV